MARVAEEAGQLALDFTASVGERTRRAKVAQAREAPLLFAMPLDLDVHLTGGKLAVVDIAGKHPEPAFSWLGRVCGSVTVLKNRRAGVPLDTLDRLLYVRPPARVTLDAGSTAVGRALWANKLGWKPIVVRRSRGRLLASSSGWPKGMAVQDAPWPAIAAIELLGLPLTVEENAKGLLLRKLAEAGQVVATAGLAGSAVALHPGLSAQS
jgi:hypothetical protein